MVDLGSPGQSATVADLALCSASDKKRRNRSEDREKGSPVRTCLGCGSKSKKVELVRLVVTAGSLVVDRKQALPGRGAYCCRNLRCYQRLVKQRKKLAWALRSPGADQPENLAVSQGLAVEFASPVPASGCKA